MVETTKPRQNLLLGLLHLDVAARDVERNRKRIFALAQEASDAGAQIIVTPEMALCGYNFANKEEISAYWTQADSPVLKELCRFTRRNRCYMLLGLAEHGPDGDFNAAVVAGPSGETALVYRKVTPIKKWADRGSPRQRSTFETPWGTVGVAICSDSYFAMLPRRAAAAGARLLLIPANWPPPTPTADLDPRNLWRARAIENGLVVAACNRTGAEAFLDCTAARSACFGPGGEVLLDATREDGEVLMARVPLQGGRLLPNTYAPAVSEVRAIGCSVTPVLVDRGARTIQVTLTGPARVRVAIAESEGATPVANLLLSPGEFEEPATGQRVSLDTPLIHELAGLRIGFCSGDVVQHPEVGAAFTAQGCDLVVVHTPQTSRGLLTDIRALERLVILDITDNRLRACIPPAGIENYQTLESADHLTFELPLERCRNKWVIEQIGLTGLLKDLLTTTSP